MLPLTEVDPTIAHDPATLGTTEREWVSVEGYRVRKFRSIMGKPAYTGRSNRGHRTVKFIVFRPDGSEVFGTHSTFKNASEALARRVITDAARDLAAAAAE